MRKITVVFDIGYLYTVESHSIPKTGVHRVIVKTIELLKQCQNINLFFYINCPHNIDHTLLENFVSKVNRETHLQNLKDVKILNWECSSHILNNLEILLSKCSNYFSNYRLLRFITQALKKFCRNLNDKIIVRNALKVIGRDSFIYHQPWLIMKNRPFNKQAKYLFTIYDLIPLKVDELRKDRHWFEQMLSYAKPESDTFLSISEHTKQDFLEYKNDINPNQVHVTHLAADEKFKSVSSEVCISTLEKYNLDPKLQYFLGIRAIDPRKNYNIVISSFINWIIQDKIKDIVLLLLSSDGLNLDLVLKALNSEHQPLIRNRIIITKYIDEDDLPAFYSGAKCFIYPSLYEGFGLPALEAMSCSTPVIASNTSSLPEIIEGNGILVDPRDELDFINAYRKITASSETRALLGENGRAHSQKYTWNNYLRNTINAYELKLRE